MSESQRVTAIPSIEDVGNVVPNGYQYYQKRITARDDLSLPTAYLKWYDISPADGEITPAQRAESREFLSSEVRKLDLRNELGFVILHRAGSWLLLMVMTWRNTNEIWESVYAKEVTSGEAYQLTTFPSTHRGTYCVWELPAVWHERQAWVRFLSSPHDEGAKLTYVNDRFEGVV